MTKKRCSKPGRRPGQGARQLVSQSIAYSALAMFLVPGVSAAASFTISGTSHTQQTLGTNETGLVQPGGTLSLPSTTAVVVNGNALSLTNQGTLEATAASYSGPAVLIQGGGNLDSLINTGTISNSPSTIAAGAVTSAGPIQGSIVNNGTISGYSPLGINTTGTASPGLTGDLTNNGVMEGATGIHIDGGMQGELTNGGTIQAASGDAVYISGNLTGGLNNTGTIQSGGADAVYISGNLNGNLENSGKIQTASGTAVYINGSVNGNILVDHATPNPVIAGSTDGIRITGDLNGELVNSSAIVATSTNTAANPTAVSFGGAFSMTNVGEIDGITAVAGNPSATSSTQGKLVNLGTINGGVILGGESDTVQIAGGQINGPVQGGGGNNQIDFAAPKFATNPSYGYTGFQTVIFAPGTAGPSDTVLQSSIDATGTSAQVAAVLSGATLDLANGGSITVNPGTSTSPNGLGNEGTVIADGGTINGNFANYGPDPSTGKTVTGTLEVPVSTGSTYGSMTVTGGADLTQGTVKAEVTGNHYVKPDGTAHTVLNAGLLLTPSGGITVQDNSAVLSFTANANTGSTPNTLTLTAHRVATYSQLTGGNRLAAKLDAIGASGSYTPGSTMDHLLGQLDAQPSGAALTRTVDSLGSRSSGSVVEASRLQGNEVGMTVEQHMQEEMQLSQSGATGMSAGDSYLNSGVWIQGFLGYAHQDGNMQSGGYAAHTDGGVVGVDTALMPGLRVGLAYSSGQTNVEGRDAAAGERLRMNTDQVTLYGSLVPAPRWYVDAQLGWALHRNDSTRMVALGGQTAMGAYDTHQYSVRAEVGRSFGSGVTLTPLARVRYSHLNSQGYTETGASPYNLRVPSQTSNYGTAGIGVRVSSQVSKYLEPEASLAYRRAFGDVNQSTQAELVSTNTTFSTRGYQANRNVGVFGVGMMIFDGNNLSVRMQYELDKASGYTAHNGAIKLRWLF